MFSSNRFASPENPLVKCSPGIPSMDNCSRLESWAMIETGYFLAFLQTLLWRYRSLRLRSLSKICTGSEKMVMLLSLRKSFCRFLVDKKAFWPSSFIPFPDKSSTSSCVQLERSWSESDLILLFFKYNAAVSFGRRFGAAARCCAEQSTAVPTSWRVQQHFTGQPVSVA